MALDAGVNPEFAVCIHENDPVESVMEVSDIVLIQGPYLEDPAPKMCGFRPTEGVFLLMRTCVDYDPLWNASGHPHKALPLTLEVPAKD